jgi:hypothetical protein
VVAGGNSPPTSSRAPVRAPACSTHPGESRGELEWSAGPPGRLAGVSGWRRGSGGGTPAVGGTVVTGEGLPSCTTSRRLRCARAHARRCYGDAGPRRALARRSSGEVTAAANREMRPCRCSGGSTEGMARWRRFRRGFVRLGGGRGATAAAHELGELAVAFRPCGGRRRRGRRGMGRVRARGSASRASWRPCRTTWPGRWTRGGHASSHFCSLSTTDANEFNT